MLSIKQVIFRIATIILSVEFLIMVFFTYASKWIPPFSEVLLDVLILCIAGMPLVYWYVIKPYAVANNELLEHMNNMALHDDLTGLGNHRAFYENLTRHVSYNVRYSNYGILLYLDLDKFKYINDHFGHEAGDAVLIEIAKRLVALIRKEDLAFRVGGDEFAILLGFHGLDVSLARQKALLTAQRIITALDEPIAFPKHRLHIGVSIGINLITPEFRSNDDIVKDADSAMYSVKQSSKSKIMFFGDQDPS